MNVDDLRAPANDNIKPEPRSSILPGKRRWISLVAAAAPFLGPEKHKPALGPSGAR